MIKFYIMEHKEELKEALKTKKEISQNEFNNLLPNYKLYCYDKRINCLRFILKDMENNFKYFNIWLLIELKI